MILSRKHRFVLVRGRKVAGTSVEMALSTLCGPEDIASPMQPRDEAQRQALGGFCGNYGAPERVERAYLQMVREGPREGLVRPPARFKAHMSVAEIETLYGPLDAFRVMCVERNPYARVISALGSAENLAERFDRAVAEDFLAQLPNLWRYRNRAGDVVAQPLRYESLAADLAAFAQDLGVKPPPLPHAKPGPMSNAIDPRGVFRRDQLDAINEVLGEEFEFGGYTRL